MIDTEGAPVAGASVLLPGQGEIGTSDADGHFPFDPHMPPGSEPLRAWAPGFYTGSTEPGKPIPQLTLQRLPAADRPDYAWQPAHPPSQGQTGADKPCANCHAGPELPLYRQWASGPHARAAKNPFFLALYNGHSSDLALQPGIGYRADFPNAPGHCATCHVPLLAVDQAHGVDPNRAGGVALEGIACDFCHKTEAIVPDPTTARTGVLALRLRRPPPGGKLSFGPLKDAVPEADAYSPIFADSRFCASCHSHRSWNQEIYGEFAEWSASPAAARGEQCQHCHMRAAAAPGFLAPVKEGGIRRPSREIHDHRMAGRDDLDLLRSAVALEVDATQTGPLLRVKVRLRHRVDGHYLPTGSPFRHLLLLVEAIDTVGNRLRQRNGERIPAWGGQGPEQAGNYAGLAGKAYAKIFFSPTNYGDGRPGNRRPPLYPAPWWRPVMLESDNRLPPGGEDTSVYTFEGGGRDVQVRVRLIHRRAFRNWFGPKRGVDDDILLATQNVGVDDKNREEP